MKIVVTGGGSGGHITPLLAIADEIKKIEPNSEISFVGQRGEKLIELVSNYPTIDSVYNIRAGKFRRYHGESLLSHLLDFKTLAKNIRDFFSVLIGIFQAIRLLYKIKPDVIFIKGGFVGVPIGIAAKFLKIPFVTHDSDAVPGLANRIVGRWAITNAVALPKEVYNYPMAKTVTVGVPINDKFTEVDNKKQEDYKKSLGRSKDSKILLVTGGGMGAQRLNNSFAKIVPSLLREFNDLYVYHIAGNKHKTETINNYNTLINSDADKKRLVVMDLVDEFYKYSGAADVIIARAGATNLAEFAAQAKACIIVPNPNLTGGHQLKNAKYLYENNAIEIIDDKSLLSDTDELLNITKTLLSDSNKRELLSKNISKFANMNAAHDLARLILIAGHLN